jgi:HTH-type transcriptional regulator/antitoxin HigA
MQVAVRPIQNEDDYDAALADVDALMDAELGTPEGARLDKLVSLIQAYEARYGDQGCFEGK